MIESMTGFGGAQHVEDGLTYALELRSVNHRFLKISIKVPEPLLIAESTMEKQIRGRIARGSINCTLRLGGEGEGEAEPATLNVAAMQRYVDLMGQVRLPTGAEARIDLGAVAVLPGVCVVADTEEAAGERRVRVIEGLITRAMDALVDMRREEGQAILRDLLGFCGELRSYVAKISTRAPVVMQEYHERLRSRVASLLQAAELELESEALMREVAIYADRCDISEELARLASHLDQFAELCDREEPIGRTLDFLTQELLREANTIAAKSSDATITRNVVEIKRLIDRLKEQVQNVQ